MNQHGRDYKKIAEHFENRSLRAIIVRFQLTTKDRNEYGQHAIFWTADEKQKFADAVREFGKDTKKI